VRLFAEQVDLVEHQQFAESSPAPMPRSTLAHLFDALLAQRIAGIDDVQQQVRLARLLQRRANAAMSSCGSSRTNPTVSASTTSPTPGSFSRRTVGSRVANSWSAT
jgi:hypothetical protein